MIELSGSTAAERCFIATDLATRMQFGRLGPDGELRVKLVPVASGIIAGDAVRMVRAIR